MEADPIIPAVSTSRRFSHLRHRSEEEEFPKDEEITSPFGDANNRKARSADLGAAKDPYSHGMIPPSGRNSNNSSTDPAGRTQSNTSQSSSNRRQDSLHPTDSEDDNETPIGLKLLAEHGSPKSQNDKHNAEASNDDMNYIDIKSFQKSPQRNKKKPPPVDYNLPDNTIRNRSVEEDRRQLELEKEAFEKTKAKHIMEKSMLDVDETIDTTQSSEQKFLSLEDVKGIFQDVKGSGILNCVGNEALDGVDDGDNMANLYEDSALLGRITSGIRDSLQILSPTTRSSSVTPKEGEIPLEIEIPTPHEDEAGKQQPVTIDTQISALDRMEEDQHQQQQQQHQQQKQETIMEVEAAVNEQQQDTIMGVAAAVSGSLMARRSTPPAPIAPTPERTNSFIQRNPAMQMSPLERKVSKVILQQMMDEEGARSERSVLQNGLRQTTKAPENVIEGITFLRQKEKVREKLEMEAKRKQDEKQKKQEEEEEANKTTLDNTQVDQSGDSDRVIEENDSCEGPFGTLRHILTNMYHGGNEITLEEYEEKVREQDAEAKPSTPQDQDVVHEKSTKKKKKSVFQRFTKNSKSKAEKKSSNDEKKKKKTNFFSKRFKKSKVAKEQGSVHDSVHDA